MITGKIALLTAGAPSFPDECYAMIPFEVGDDITVENFINYLYGEMEEPLGFIKMMAPDACIKGWVFCAQHGTRALVQAILADNGIQICHE